MVLWIIAFYYSQRVAVVDPGFPVGAGRQPHFVCRNEII